MAKASTTINWEGHEVTYAWIPGADPAKFAPVTQVYGVCFDKEGKILITKDKRWQIPGGTPEEGESLAETLKRELLEEAQIEVGVVFPLGVQEVLFPNNPNKDEGDLYYQARFIVFIEKINPQAADPDTGRMYERKFVSIGEINDYIKWGELGKEMFNDAWELYQNKRR